MIQEITQCIQEVILTLILNIMTSILLDWIEHKYHRSKLGDGIKEVCKAEELGWYEDFLMIGNSTGYPWIVRGSNKGYGQSINSGIFSSRNYYGYAYEPVSTRIIIN